MSDGRLREERGLVGKALVLIVVLIALFGIAITDGGSILVTRFKLDDEAQQAASDAAATFRDSRDRQKACVAAVASLRETDPEARLTGCTVDTTTGGVTISVTKKASTFVVRRLGFLKHFQKVQATETALPPTG